jgi:hypothetical protein
MIIHDPTGIYQMRNFCHNPTGIYQMRNFCHDPTGIYQMRNPTVKAIQIKMRSLISFFAPMMSNMLASAYLGKKSRQFDSFLYLGTRCKSEDFLIYNFDASVVVGYIERFQSRRKLFCVQNALGYPLCCKY